MSETAATYGWLEEALLALGFEKQVVPGKAWVYQHEPTGARIFLPESSPEEAVFPYHLVYVRTVLRDHGIAGTAELDSRLQRAS